MIKKKVIWIDMDEVIAETIDWLLKFYNNSINWVYLTKDLIDDYYIENIPHLNLSRKQSFDLFYNFFEAEIENFHTKPVEWAFDKLSEIKWLWYELNIITARRDKIHEYTISWVNKYYPWIFANIHYTNHFTQYEVTKSEILKKIWASYMFEDNIRYAQEISENSWVKTFLISQPWNLKFNLNNENISRVNSWSDFKLENL